MKGKVLMGLFILAAMVYFVGCSTMRGTSVTQTGKDELITSEIKAKLVADRVLHSFRIDVATYDGVVTLAGIVPNREAEQRAINVAQGVGGVKAVQNALQVGPSTASR